jgi:nicotinamide phosphoribosyltransferase
MTMFNSNPLLAVDSYKYSHFNLLPPGTTVINSYIESRGGEFENTLFFGLQVFLKNFMMQRVTRANVEEYVEIATAHGLPVNAEGMERLVTVHGGRWPVVIEAVPEGTVLPVRNVLMQIRNTDPEMPWVTSFLETALLRAVWYPTTVASLSWQAKQMILGALRTSSDDAEGQISFKLHDFSARGVTSSESAALGGMAHLVNFMGTDTVEALVAARKFYGAQMAGFSIPASEHSTITSWGRDNEVDAYDNMLTQFARPGSILAVVSDSYDLWNAVSNIWGETLRQKVVDSGATVVIRPDSGDPLTVPIKTIELLGDKFGFTTNQKGYKVLPSCVRVIQGDGITIHTLPMILDNLLKSGWSADNLAFGMGAGLSQKVDRDTQRFAMKSNAMCINGEWRDVFKDPITDPGKTSKKGILSLVRSAGIGNNKWRTIRRSDLSSGEMDQLKVVYKNGEIREDYSFDDIRERANTSI